MLTVTTPMRVQSLHIKLKWICQGEKENYDLEKLRIYLDGDTPLVSSLYQLFMNAQTSRMRRRLWPHEC